MKKPTDPLKKHREDVMKSAGKNFQTAVGKLVDQMESESESVSQRAAKELIDLFADAVLKSDDREVVVRIEGMPAIGMPEEPTQHGIPH